MENIEIGQNYTFILGPQFFAGRVKSITEETVMLENASLIWDTTSYPKMDCEDHLETVQRFEYLGRTPLRISHVTMAFPWRGGLPEQHNSFQPRRSWTSKKELEDLEANWVEFGEKLSKIYTAAGETDIVTKSPTGHSFSLTAKDRNQHVSVSYTPPCRGHGGGYVTILSFAQNTSGPSIQIRNSSLDEVLENMASLVCANNQKEGMEICRSQRTKKSAWNTFCNDVAKHYRKVYGTGVETFSSGLNTSAGFVGTWSCNSRAQQMTFRRNNDQVSVVIAFPQSQTNNAEFQIPECSFDDMLDKIKAICFCSDSDTATIALRMHEA